jgi:rhodanese-related sulfurtransferase
MNSSRATGLPSRTMKASGRSPEREGGDGASSIDLVLASVRARIERIEPREAKAWQDGGALLVDTRPSELRSTHGHIPGALVIDRNVLEWRLDPSSPHRHPAMVSADQPTVVFCQEGYASSLAVALLGELGLRRVADLDGGFAAWASVGLPVER